MVLVYILILVVILVINAVVADKFSEIAEMKGHEGKPYFWFTFFLGFIGMLMVVALPNITGPKAAESQVPQQYNPAPAPRPASQPAFYNQPKPVGGWTCTCGRQHQGYETSCICGVTKASLNRPPVSQAAPAQSAEMKKCPKCGLPQKQDRTVCWSCGQRFED